MTSINKNMQVGESKIVESIRQTLHQRGCYVVKHHGSGFGVAGTPDLLICAPGGVFVGIEVKRPQTRERVSPLQAKRLREIVEAGGRAGVAASVEEAVAIVFPEV